MYYYFLTNEGIDYLREVLHLPLLKVLQSLCSRDYVTEKFNRQRYYFLTFLTNEGIDYLREVLHLPLMMVLQSLYSRGYVTEKFNWQPYYHFLTNEGIGYLREVLGPQFFSHLTADPGQGAFDLAHSAMAGIHSALQHQQADARWRRVTVLDMVRLRASSRSTSRSSLTRSTPLSLLGTVALA